MLPLVAKVTPPNCTPTMKQVTHTVARTSVVRTATGRCRDMTLDSRTTARVHSARSATIRTITPTIASTSPVRPNVSRSQSVALPSMIQSKTRSNGRARVW